MSKTLDDKAWDEAVSTALSDLGGLTANEILDKLERGEMPEEIMVWQPFEGYDARNLLELIDGFQAQFRRFGEELLKGASK